MPDCIFCQIASGLSPALVVLATSELLAVMDLYPATRGHVLILPREHIETIYDMPEELGGNLMRQAIAIAKALQRQLKPAGINLIQANGSEAGQTIAHFHLHLVPRYHEDHVVLQFGHRGAAHDLRELEELSLLIKAGLNLPSV